MRKREASTVARPEVELDLTVRAYDAINPIFTAELGMTPNDPEAAFDRALLWAKATALSDGEWSQVPHRLFRDRVRALAFGLHGIIPPMSIILTPDRRIIPTPDSLQ